MHPRFPRRLYRLLSLLLMASMLLPSGALLTPVMAGDRSIEPWARPAQEATPSEVVPTPYPTPYWPEVGQWMQPQYTPLLAPLPEPHAR